MNQNDALGYPVESDLLRSFLSVARHGNVTRAAKELNRTQSAISVQLKRLEQRLATRLFERQARGVSLTESGELLLSQAERVISDLDSITRSFASAPIRGKVSIGIPDDYGSDVLPDILASFARKHPEIEVFVQCEFGAAFDEAVACGDLDLAVTAREASSTQAYCLLEEQTVWVSSKNYSPDFEQPLPLALFDRSCWWRDSAVEALDRAKIGYRIAYSSESVSGVKAAIVAGLAIGMLSKSNLDDSLSIIEALPALPKTRLLLLESKDPQTPSVAAMSEAIRQSFASL